MNEKIDELTSGLDHLKDRDHQPTEMGDLYNGMLKSTVRFEIEHMKHLKQELVDLLG